MFPTIRLSLDIQGRIERPCPSVISWLNSSRTQITEIFAESQLDHFLNEKKKKKKGRRHAWVPFASPISNEHFLGLELSKMQHSTVQGGPTPEIEIFHMLFDRSLSVFCDILQTAYGILPFLE